MKVLVFSTADFSIGSGSEIRGRLICEGLHQLNVKICIVCKNIPDYFLSLGIEFISTDLGFENALESAICSFKPDIVYGITEGFANLVTKFAKKYGCGLVFDMHGIGVVEILELGKGYGPRKIRLKNSANWLLSMKKADLITVANPTLVSIANKFYYNVVPVIGMTDTTHFSPNGITHRLGNNENLTQVLYAGNYFKWQGVDLLFEVMENLLYDNFEFTLLGSVGRTDQFLERWRKVLQNERVHIIDSVDYQVVPQYYRGANVTLIPRKFMWSTHLAFPQKIVDYMASGRVIVATDLAPHRWALCEPKSGILCEPNVQSFIQGLKEAQNKDNNSILAHNAHLEAEKRFDHIKQAKVILDAFETIF